MGDDARRRVLESFGSLTEAWRHGFDVNGGRAVDQNTFVAASNRIMGPSPETLATSQMRASRSSGGTNGGLGSFSVCCVAGLANCFSQKRTSKLYSSACLQMTVPMCGAAKPAPNRNTRPPHGFPTVNYR